MLAFYFRLSIIRPGFGPDAALTRAPRATIALASAARDA
jgi:hypothetical protein